MSDCDALKMLEDEMQFLRDRLARLGQMRAEIEKRIKETQRLNTSVDIPVKQGV